MLLLVSSCIKSPYYQKEYTIPNYKWDYNNPSSFKFEISDTNALYNLYFLVRHTEAYPYSNIWLMIYTKKPGDTTFTPSRIEVPLAEPTGKWLGRGMGEIWEQRMPISHDGDTAMLRKEGTWEIKFAQDMRMNPLPEVLQVGLRIEKKAKR
ncbi:MAG: gliding motility lipoprotein GldH [Chitinophagaceae bacterium]|nr:gliding motility lipoprotein GldH [Chitinophagaceae bacterium]